MVDGRYLTITIHLFYRFIIKIHVFTITSVVIIFIIIISISITLSIFIATHNFLPINRRILYHRRNFLVLNHLRFNLSLLSSWAPLRETGTMLRIWSLCKSWNCHILGSVKNFIFHSSIGMFYELGDFVPKLHYESTWNIRKFKRW